MKRKAGIGTINNPRVIGGEGSSWRGTTEDWFDQRIRGLEAMGKDFSALAERVRELEERCPEKKKCPKCGK